MKILVDEMRIIIDLDMNLNGYDLLQSIASWRCFNTSRMIVERGRDNAVAIS